MPKIYLCFLWHMHQPFYKDLVTGEYRLPWTRMHALKDYYGMVKILEEFPGIRQTFNLVPSMVVQVEEYASGAARDPFLECALKPAEQLTAEEQEFLLRNFFMANPGRMIHRYPRYGELYSALQAQKSASAKDGRGTFRGTFGNQEFRDLQILSQVAWFDEEFQEHDAEVKGLVEKGRNFSLADQGLMGKKQREICGRVIPEYQKLAGTGQIEISTTPFYHPILPLLCDSDIAAVSHPHVELPKRFTYPEDARLQLEMSREYIAKTFGVAPVGLWPSEGSVSDHVLDIAASVGFEWAATDNGVLDRTLRRAATPEVTYKPYLWSQHGKQIRMIFRDHLLSDLIGFVYSGMNPGDAAQDFLHRIQENCKGLVNSGRDALVPIILDGENAWEYYDHNGRPFFRELYRRIEENPRMEALTVSEALKRMTPEPLEHIFPGSWINANFDVWLGAEEDNKSWQMLLEARQAFGAAVEDKAKPLAADRVKLAREELLIAEGSDWNWWYGPEHDSANRIEFDQIYREHLANMYRALGVAPPAALSFPILNSRTEEAQTPPAGPISPKVNGVVDSYFEWLGSGCYRVDQRSGSMHGKRNVVKEVWYGADAGGIYVRIDFGESAAELDGLEVHAEVKARTGVAGAEFRAELRGGAARMILGEGEAAFKEVMEMSLTRGAGSGTEEGDRFRLSFWQDGLPIGAVPQQDWLDVSSVEGGWAR